MFTNIMANQINVDVKPALIYSACIDAPFDEGKEALEQKDYSIISLEENAALRRQQGKESPVSKNGNWVREGVIYVQNKGTFLTKSSPIMANPKEATACNRKGQWYYLTDKQVEESLEGSIMFPKERELPTDRLGEIELTSYAFGNEAKDYGLFLKDAGIKELSILLANIEETPFAVQLWFRGLGDRSELDGNGRGLDGNYRVRGVRRAKNFP